MSRQRYVSDELAHFVGKGKSVAEQYDLLLKVISEGWISHPPHKPLDQTVNHKMIQIDTSKEFSDMIVSQVICFCDIPNGDLNIHMDKYSKFGIAFKKHFLIHNGASPVFYIAQDSLIDKSDAHDPTRTRKEVFAEIVNGYTNVQSMWASAVVQNIHDEKIRTELMELMHFGSQFTSYILAYMKPFDAEKSDDDPDNYYMEREWRILGNLKFTVEDIATVYLPRSYAYQFRASVPDFYGQVIFTD